MRASRVDTSLRPDCVHEPVAGDAELRDLRLRERLAAQRLDRKAPELANVHVPGNGHAAPSIPLGKSCGVRKPRGAAGPAVARASGPRTRPGASAARSLAADPCEPGLGDPR